MGKLDHSPGQNPHVTGQSNGTLEYEEHCPELNPQNGVPIPVQFTENKVHM